MLHKFKYNTPPGSNLRIPQPGFWAHRTEQAYTARRTGRFSTWPSISPLISYYIVVVVDWSGSWDITGSCLGNTNQCGEIAQLWLVLVRLYSFTLVGIEYYSLVNMSGRMYICFLHLYKEISALRILERLSVHWYTITSCILTYTLAQEWHKKYPCWYLEFQPSWSYQI